MVDRRLACRGCGVGKQEVPLGGERERESGALKSHYGIAFVLVGYIVSGLAWRAGATKHEIFINQIARKHLQQQHLPVTRCSC